MAVSLLKVFTDLQAKVNEGDKTLIDEYGATNPAEFFSVVTETFLRNRITSKEAPRTLQAFCRVLPS